jgi:phosphoenolpyruvate carboxylase
MLEHAFRAQSEIAFEHYFAEIHALGAELPLSRLLARITPELDRLGALSPDRSAHREDEPYRRALTGIYARLPPPPPRSDSRASIAARRRREPYPDAASLREDLDVIDRSLRAAGGALLADGRCGGCGAPCAHSASTSRPWTCARTRTCTRAVIAELLRGAGLVTDYAGFAERSAVACCSRSSLRRGCCEPASRHIRSERWESWRSSRPRARPAQRLGADAIRNYIISKTGEVSDLLEVAVLLKEAGSSCRASFRLEPADRPALRDDRRSAARAGIMADGSRCPPCKASSSRSASSRK